VNSVAEDAQGTAKTDFFLWPVTLRKMQKMKVPFAFYVFSVRGSACAGTLLLPGGYLQPFTAPSVRPCTTYFWKIIVRMIAGVMIATAAAMTAPQSTSA